MSTEGLTRQLVELKSIGCCGIKVSFEDEGALLNEITTMRYLTAAVGLELSIKIGGCEAKRDINDVQNLCADYIVAPMVESAFALKKFTESLDQYTFSGSKGINIETKLAVNNMDDMRPLLSGLDFITFGRVDYVGSLQQSRSAVDSEEVFEDVKRTFEIGKTAGVKCYMGGSISPKSKSFISRLLADGLLDKFETRYVMYDTRKIDMDHYDEIIYKANLFEIEWINYIGSRYGQLKDKDSARVRMLLSRLNQ